MAFDIRDHIDHLEPHPRESGKYFCPACGGHNLSVNLTTGAYNCWSDDTENHRKLIRENLSPAKLEPTRASPGYKEWKYKTVSGEVAATVTRRDFEDPEKPKEVRRDQKEDLMNDVAPLYWEECIAEYSENGGRVFIVEGEMCVEEMRAIGLNAITLIGGSTAYKKERYYDLLFQIRDGIVLVPDMDKPGIKFMDSIARDFPEALWCYVQGPNYYYWGAERLPDKGGYDIADAIRKGADVERIISWIHRHQSFALTGQALEADVEVNTMLEGLAKVYSETLDIAVREVKIAQYLKTSGLKDLGWTIQRAIRHCCTQAYNTSSLEVFDAHDLLTMPTKRPRWIIPGFMPCGSVILLGASGGTGKTTLCYNLAKHIALGEEWSEFPVVQGKVLIISTDESTHDTKEKLQTIDYASVPRGAVSFIRFWRFTQIDLLEEKIRQLEPTLIIVDSLTSTTAGIAADRTSSSAGDCLYELRDMAEKYECTFMVLHHLNKQDQFRDSTSYVDNVSEAWKLTKDDKNNNHFIIDYEKSRAGFQGKAVLHRQLEQYKWNVVGRLESSCEWSVEQRVARYINTHLRVHGTENWLNIDQIAARATGCTRGDVISAMGILRITGRVACDTSIFMGMTQRRYASWDSSPHALPESNVIPIKPVDENADDLDELLGQVHFAYQSGESGAVMAQMLETYPWEGGKKKQFWLMLDDHLKQWLKPAAQRA